MDSTNSIDATDATAANDSMVSMAGVAFGYRRADRLFEGFDFALRPGNVYGLLGRNGAGKTTLLRLISGLLFPKEGQVVVAGQHAAARSPALLRELYFVAEEFHTPALTANELATLYGVFYPRFDRDAMGRFLAEFETDPDQRMSSMSFGQKKKVILAFAIATRCRLLILDEPTNALDIPAKGQFRRLLAAAADPDRVIIVSTHQVRDLEYLIDPIVVLEQGRIVFQHSVAEISHRLTVDEAAQEGADAAGSPVVYAERGGSGRGSVRALVASHGVGGVGGAGVNSPADDAAVDIELLFNAIVADPSRVEEAFSNAQ